ncbi:MAG: putative glutathione-dependent formaldehyde-activating enzyme [Myxococcaceae bacterium]|nr:putative glutathione-dependent formaldehyde-activating enzyme [Myxococcaceae bacterium]
MRQPELPWDGGCRCDRVRFRVSAAPLLTMACHCAGCQRMTSSAFSLSVAVPTAGFALTRGEPVLGGLHGEVQHYGCPYCMSWIFTRPTGIDTFVNVRPTLLDDPRWFAPFIETWTSERLPWATTPAVHSYEKLPAMEEYAALTAEYAASVS